jgi:hypothetical protein
VNEKKFTEYLNSLEITEIYDLYQLGDEFTPEALKIMEKVALEKDGYTLKKETQGLNKYLAVPFVLLMILISEFIQQIFKSLGLFITLTVYAIGFGIYYFSKWIEISDLSEYERKVKKLRESEGMAEIIIAIADKDINKFNELFEMGRNIHKKTKNEWTALMYAVINDELEIAKILLANGSDANEKTKSGVSAKTLAAKNNLEEMKLLLEKN